METRHRERTVYTVAEVSRRVKEMVEGEFPDIWVEGEVSNLRRSSAGHIYFTLKDPKAQLPAVCFRGAAMYLRFKPQNGESFRARGRLSTYEARGEYQIIVDVLEPAGRGALQEAFERLKERLSQEGLFDLARKRDLPGLPAMLGIVTSPGSAALRDILTVLERRHDSIDILIYPTDVQGNAAAPQIVEGIEYFSKSDVDVVILTRGGGSAEDLWPFNDESVARAIFRCAKPVISAIGHETDFTISDLVADERAPTPSAAAEMVVKSKVEVLDRLRRADGRAAASIRYKLSELGRFLAAKAGGPGFVAAERRIHGLSQRVDDCAFRLERFATSGRLRQIRQRVGEYGHSLELFARSGRFISVASMRLETLDRSVLNAIQGRVSRSGERFRTLAETLEALSPLAVLDRGYAVCRQPGGAVVRSTAGLDVDSQIEIVVRRGTIDARVTRVRHAEER